MPEARIAIYLSLRQPDILPYRHRQPHCNWRDFIAYVLLLFCLHIYTWRLSSAHFIRRDLHYASGNWWFFRRSAELPSGGNYIYYIYIYLGNKSVSKHVRVKEHGLFPFQNLHVKSLLGIFLMSGSRWWRKYPILAQKFSTL